MLRIKRAFPPQFHLKEHGYQSHAEWKQAWNEARSNEFLMLCSSLDGAGGEGWLVTRAEDGSFSLHVRLSNAGIAENLTINPINLPSGQNNFEELLAANGIFGYRFFRDATCTTRLSVTRRPRRPAQPVMTKPNRLGT